MADTGWLNPASGALRQVDDTAGGASFTRAADSLIASGGNMCRTFTLVGITDTLLCWNFGASVPTGATIDGLEVQSRQYEQYQDSSSEGTINFALTNADAGTPTYATTSKNNNFTTSMSYQSFGSSSDLWGESSIADTTVNSTDFGVAFSGITGGAFGNDFQIDHVQIKIHYTEAASTTPYRVSFIGL